MLMLKTRGGASTFVAVNKVNNLSATSKGRGGVILGQQAKPLRLLPGGEERVLGFWVLRGGFCYPGVRKNGFFP